MKLYPTTCLSWNTLGQKYFFLLDVLAGREVYFVLTNENPNTVKAELQTVAKKCFPQFNFTFKRKYDRISACFLKKGLTPAGKLLRTKEMNKKEKDPKEKRSSFFSGTVSGANFNFTKNAIKLEEEIMTQQERENW